MQQQWRGWPWVAAGAAGLAVVVAVGAALGASSRGGSTAAPATTVTVVETEVITETVPAPEAAAPETTTPPAAAGPASTFGAGTHEVGVDVQPGKYKTEGPDGSNIVGCSWFRKSGDGTKTLDLDVSDGPSVVTVNAGELINTSGCKPWAKAA